MFVSSLKVTIYISFLETWLNLNYMILRKCYVIYVLPPNTEHIAFKNLLSLDVSIYLNKMDSILCVGFEKIICIQLYRDK